MKKQGRPSEYESAIADIFKQSPKGTHLTAPEVFAKAKELGLPVSISTVYRTLHRLKTVGNVSTVAGDRKLRYESADEVPDHDHLICLGCGITVEFIDHRLPTFGQTVAKRKGFIHAKSRFDILGYCSKCYKSDDQARQLKISAQWQSAKTALKEALDLLNGLSEITFAENKLDETIAENQSAIEYLHHALGSCETIDKLLNRSARPSDL